MAVSGFGITSSFISLTGTRGATVSNHQQSWWLEEGP